MADESTPLIDDNAKTDPHHQFCMLIGIPPSDGSHPYRYEQSLYNRAMKKRKGQQLTYTFTAALTNTLLLVQVVLGATLTALGASSSSHILITIFGVLNTVIAGIVAWLKSRGQPMRTRMFLDDLDHVVEEIHNSKTMWLGIHNKIHGYDEVDVDDKVSVRSEVARLTRLYESANKKYTQNNPDMYSMSGGVLDAITGLRSRPPAGAQMQVPGPAEHSFAHVHGHVDEEESPATAKRTKPSIWVDTQTKDAKKGEEEDKKSPASAVHSVDKPNGGCNATGENAKANNDAKSKDKAAETDDHLDKSPPDNKHNEDGDTTAGATSEKKTANDPKVEQPQPTTTSGEQEGNNNAGGKAVEGAKDSI
ncbi:MAG: hypothetical protein Q9219_005012 [cf. Caloplaca sp. 3 TL-2023]